MKHIEVKHKDGRPLLLPRSPRTIHILFALVILILAIIEIQFSIDSYDFWYRTVRHWGVKPFQLNHMARVANYFPEFLVFLIAAIVVWIHKREWRHTIITMIIAIALASTITGVIKDVAGRARPHHGVRLQTDSERVERVQEFLAGLEAPHPIIRAEDGDYWLIKLLWIQPDLYFNRAHRPWFRGDYASFPSGHATSAFVLAAWLALILPRTKYVWYFLAVFTCLGRVFMVRHYPGDVMTGAVIGWGTTQFLFGSFLVTKISVKTTELLEVVLEPKGSKPVPEPEESEEVPASRR